MKAMSMGGLGRMGSVALGVVLIASAASAFPIHTRSADVSVPFTATDAPGANGCSAAKAASFAPQSVAGLFETDLTLSPEIPGGPRACGRQPGPGSHRGG